MSYKDVMADLKNNQLSHIYLFHGTEFYLMEHAIRGIKNKLVDDGFSELNYQVIDGKDTTVDQIINACETLPFMAEARLVIVKDLECFAGKRKNISEDEEKRLIEYLSNISYTTYLLFTVTEGLDKRKKIVKDIGKYGKVVEFDKMDGTDLSKWVAKSFGKFGKKISEKDILRFIEVSSYLEKGSNKSLKDLENEIKKISDYIGDQPIVSLKDIELLAPKTIENNIFNLVESIGEKKGEKALMLLSDMLLEGEPEIRILFMITRQFRILYQIKLMESQGYTPMAIAPKLGLQQFIVKKYLKQTTNFDKNSLQMALYKCLETDRGIKKGKISPRLGMELLISEFATYVK
ncbi:DNA polymerase-3 subunit delta [Anaerosolibacter carboniphilus]|uniref:DNA polymerase III subunit delta n=1 Tax=Anaerosolibacter carboniphilus TaxID=1417629 RepID=A0A841KX63_9FIRM|nr:DNA polymerase III subunit delta [Anaerosolibacter carboniphilus]MBB6217947.1 DNA polymerase-3 subunit delta [Anaerosolibacter carboniphilus]